MNADEALSFAKQDAANASDAYEAAALAAALGDADKQSAAPRARGLRGGPRPAALRRGLGRGDVLG